MFQNSKIKLLDDVDLRNTLLSEYELRSQTELCLYAISLAEHILDLTHYDGVDNELILDGFAVNAEWRRGNASVGDVRKAGFKIHALAKSYDDPLAKTALRVVGHAVATAHMKEHCMVASDYAVKAVNIMRLGDLDAVKAERLWQIEKIKNLKD